METLETELIAKPVPALKKRWLVGNTLEFAKDPLGFLLNLQRRYERIVKFRLPMGDVHVIFQPDDIKHVLQENNRNYRKSRAYRVLEIFLGQGLLTSEGDFWRRQRRLAQPAFHKQRLALMVNTMNQETVKMLERWERGNRHDDLDMLEEMMQVTLLIVSKALFGADVKHLIGNISDALVNVNEFGNNRLKSLIQFPLSFPLPSHIKFRESVEKIENIIYTIIEERRKALLENPDAQFDDLLQMLMTAEDEETGERMNDKQLRDEITTLFMAGHETTANAMSWACYLLAKYPDVAQKIRNESLSVLGENGLPTMDDLKDLRYTMQVVQETMRLYPPAYVFSRMAYQPDRFGEYEVPVNATVLMSPYLLHRHPDYWEHPTEFNPDNFLPERIKERHSYAYLPFGGGPRLCIGNNFALMEMQIMLALMVRMFDFKLVGRDQVQPEPLITLRPKNGLKVRLQCV
ncbi:MAG: cytochrome P450 [Spirosomataceae bacterium]